MFEDGSPPRVGGGGAWVAFQNKSGWILVQVLEKYLIPRGSIIVIWLIHRNHHNELPCMFFCQLLDYYGAAFTDARLAEDKDMNQLETNSLVHRPQQLNIRPKRKQMLFCGCGR